MYPGRSIWTRGVLALGVGALFLLGWRISSTGDASSASASVRISSSKIDSNRNYFSVVLASSRSQRGRDDDDDEEERKKEDSLRQDRPVEGDYSAGDAELDVEHGTGYSAERSLPFAKDYREPTSLAELTDVSTLPKYSSNDDENGETRTVDDNQFSKDREPFNGSDVGERSHVNENSSRQVNGDSMNEVVEDFEPTYYLDFPGRTETVATSSGKYFHPEETDDKEVATGIVSDFRNSEESARRKRKRGTVDEESISGYPPAFSRRRRSNGMQKDRARFFRDQSSANTLESRKGRSSERKIHEAGRSANRSPPAVDLSVDFRAIRGERNNQMLEGDEVTDPSGDGDYFTGERDSSASFSDNVKLDETTPLENLQNIQKIFKNSEIEKTRLDHRKVSSLDGRLSLSLLGDGNFQPGKNKVRRKRYTNYYSPQSVTPMAYVHIQPVYPVATPPPANRKCVRCMVVYKPCPSMPRQPPRVVLPTYKYQEPASKWHGLKYGE